ncbi:hypothetical protein N9F27_03145, partial [Crocinitomicaceae bacterium]|nr:hypothetical protein [Crocinitomicaceae bacterium]
MNNYYQIKEAIKSNFLKILFFIVSIYSCNCSFAQTVSFTTSPTVLNDTIKVCAGQSITYTNTSTVPTGSNYNWVFNGGDSTTQNTAGPHSINYSIPGIYTTSLTVGSQTYSSVVWVQPGVTGNVLSINSNINFDNTVNQGVTTFTYCGTSIPYSASVPFNFQVSNSVFPLNSVLSIDWGDGTPITVISNAATSVPHTYNGSISNFHILTLTITTPSGCTFNQIYNVFQGVAPTINLSGNGQNACIPYDYDFLLLSNNVPNTIYIINFNDGSNPDTLTVPFNSNITHTFNNTSCGTTSTTSSTGTYNNAFQCGITAINSCASTSVTIAPIYVSQSVQANTVISPGNTLCQNDVMSITNNSYSGINTYNGSCDSTQSFFWEITPSTGFTLLNGTYGSSNSFLPDFTFWTSGSPTLDIQFSDTGVYEIDLFTANGCGLDSVKQIIQVNPIPIISDYQETICTGDNFDYSPVNNPPSEQVPPGTIYNWTVSSNPNIVGASSGSGSSISDTLVNLASTSQNVIYTVVPTVNGCDGEPFDVTITVVPGLLLPDYTQTICNGGSINFSPQNNPPTVIIPSGSTYTWTVVDNPNVIGESGGMGLAVIDTLTSLLYTPLQSVTYSVVGQSGSNCDSDTFNLTININTISIPTIDSNQTVCSGGDPDPLTFSSLPVGAGNLSYQWQSTDSLSGVFTNLIGDTLPTYDPPGGLMNTTYYRVWVNSEIGGVYCGEYSNVVTISVNDLTIPVISGDTTICFGDDPSVIGLTDSLISSGVLSYQWQSSNSITGPFVDVLNDTNTIFDPAILLSNTYYQLVATSVLNGVACTNNSNTVSIVINEVSAPNLFIDQVLCFGGDPNPISISSGTGSGVLTYNWLSSTTSASSGFVSVQDSPNLSYDPAAGIQNTTFYQVITTSTFNGVTCVDSSNVDTLLVNFSNANTISADQTICMGGDPVILDTITAAAGAGNLTYQWQSSMNINGPFTDLLNETNASYDPPNGLMTDTYYRLIVNSDLNGQNCLDSSNIVQVTINNVASGVNSPDQTICSGGDPDSLFFVAPESGSGALSYQWQSSVTSATSGFSNILGATNNVYDPPNGLTSTTYYQLLTYSTLSNVICESLSSPFVVEINSLTPSVIGSDQTICSGGNPALLFPTSTAFGSGILSYQWQVATDTTSGFTDLIGDTLSTYDPPGGLMNTTYYQVQVSSQLNGVFCNMESNFVSVLVNPNPISDAGNDTILNCLNLASGIAIGSNNLIGLNYSWTPSVGLSDSTIANPTASIANLYTLTTTDSNTGCFSLDSVLVTLNNQPPAVFAGFDDTITCINNPNGFQIGMASASGFSYNWVPNLDLTSDTISNPIATPGISTQYILTVYDSINGCTNSDSVFVFVDTIKPIANAGSDGIITCTSNAAGLTIGSSAIPGYNYLWAPPNNLSSSIVASPIASPTNSTNYILNVTNQINGCIASDSVYVTATVDLPLVDAGLDQYICNGSSITLAGTGATFYTWDNGVIDQAPFQPLSTGSYILTGIDSTSGCQNTDTVLVTVNPIPVVVLPLDQVVCNNSQTADVFFSSSTAGATFTWENNNTAIGLTSTGNGDILSFTATNTTNFPIVATIAVMPSFENGGVSCDGDTVSFTLTVNPTPSVDSSIDQIICSGTTSDTVQFTSSFGVVGTIFNWTNDNTTIGLSASYCQYSGSVLPLHANSNGTSTSYAYQWYNNSNNTSVGGSLISGANSSTYLPPVNSIGIVYYYCIMSEDTSVTNCSFVSNLAGITTNSGPTFTSQPISSQTVCVDGTLNPLSVAYQNGTGTPTYQWYSNTVNSITGGMAINGENLSTYSPSSLVSGT